MWEFIKKKQTIEEKDEQSSEEFLNEETNNVTELVIDSDIEAEEEEEINNKTFALYLLFSDSFKLNTKKVKRRIEQLGEESVKINDLLEWEETNRIFAYVTIGEEKFKIVGFDMTIPSDIVKYTINCAHGKEEHIDEMKKHKYHIIAFYEGKNTDYQKIYNAYAKLSYGFIEDNLVGLVNGNCWNAISSNLIQGMFENEVIKKYVYKPEMFIWRNIIKIPYKGELWFATKGNNFYGAHEYVFKGSINNYKKIHDIFEEVFEYEYYEKKKIRVGQVIEISKNIKIRFIDVYENKEKLLEDGVDTIAIEIV